MAQLNKPICFLASCDAGRSREFYESVLKLPCLNEDLYALEFDLGSSTLRVQIVESIPDVSYTALGWEVTNIEQSVQDLSAAGVKFELFQQLEQNELGIWCSPSGALIAWFKDPDGNTLSLTQRA